MHETAIGRAPVRQPDLYDQAKGAAPDLRGQLRALRELGRTHEESEVELVRGRLFRDHGHVVRQAR